VDTQQHCCPNPHGNDGGWVGRGNIRANGHPGGGPWRQLPCTACRRYFQETHGTPLHGKRVPPERLVWAVGALAEGLGIRAVARVFEVDPNTVLAWLIEVADHAAAFSRHFLHDVYVTQVQLDELFALLSAVTAGEVSETESIQPLTRSAHWPYGTVAAIIPNKLYLHAKKEIFTPPQPISILQPISHVRGNRHFFPFLSASQPPLQWFSWRIARAIHEKGHSSALRRSL